MKVYGVAGYTSHVVYDSSLGEVKPVGLVQGSDAVDTATGDWYTWIGAAWVLYTGFSALPEYATMANFALVAAAAGNNGVTYECPILGNDGATEVGRGRWTCMPISGVPTYAWHLVRCDMSGTDDNRPSCATLANGATFVGAQYYATDTLAVYVCKAAGVWIVRSANDAPETTGHGPFSLGLGHTTYQRTGGDPSGGANTSIVLLYKTPAVAPAAPETMFENGVCGAGGPGAPGVVRGTHVYNHDDGHGTFCVSCIWMQGVGGVRYALPNSDFSGVLWNDCGLAISVVWTGAAYQFRYSFNGGAVDVVAAGAGPYVPPNTGDPIAIGNNQDTLDSPFTGLMKAVVVIARVLSDAELQVASAINTSRIPTQGSVLTFDWASQRIPEGTRQYTCSGHNFTTTRNSVTTGTAQRWWY